eukprot:366188-Chlamydomonas_euryale.AAC.6
MDSAHGVHLTLVATSVVPYQLQRWYGTTRGLPFASSIDVVAVQVLPCQCWYGTTKMAPECVHVMRSDVRASRAAACCEQHIAWLRLGDFPCEAQYSTCTMSKIFYLGQGLSVTIFYDECHTLCEQVPHTGCHTLCE